MNKVSWSLFLFILLITNTSTIGQNQFRKEYNELNPINSVMNLNNTERKIIHSKFLSEAKAVKDRRKEFFGYLFLTSDYMRNEDFVEAKRMMIAADSISSLENFPHWKGHILHRKAIFALNVEKEDEAIGYYESSIPFCKIAQDSLCLGETYEQLSSLYGSKNEHAKADSFYTLSIPLLTKFGTAKSLATLYNNHAIMLGERGKHMSSIEYYNKAIISYASINDSFSVAIAKHNLASAYRESGQFTKALKMIEEVISNNRITGNHDNLYKNYQNLSAVYDSLKDYKSALMYFSFYHELRDSLLGIDKQKEIEDLNIRYEMEKKDAIIAKNETELYKTKQKNLTRIILFLTTLILSLIGGIALYLRNTKLKNKLYSSEEKANILENINITKSDKILQLEAEITKFKMDNPHLNNLILPSLPSNLSILTNNDWIVFKEYFHAINPNYIQRMRSEHPTLTEAEERLFMLLKLKFNNKEIATILGIANDSVKKTRSRLRKKLDLDSELNLDNFIEKF